MKTNRSILCRYVLFMLLLIVAAHLLTGCSYVSYSSDNISVIGIEFGTDKALAGFTYETSHGKVSLESLEKNQTNSLSALVEGAVKGAIKGVKP